MSGVAERLAQAARLQPGGFIDACSVTGGRCAVCEAIERVAQLAIHAALDEAAKVARDAPTDTHALGNGRAVVGVFADKYRLASAIEALK